MSSDSRKAEIFVKADTTGLDKGMNEAADKVKESTDRMKVSLGSLQDFANNMRALSDIFNTVAGAINNLTTATSKYADNLESLSAITGDMGKSTQILANQLAIAGVETSTYTDFATKLVARVAQNEELFKKYGVAVRDSSGELLQTAQITANVIETINRYKVGVDQSSVAVTLLGEKSKDLVEIRKLDATSLAEATAMTEAFGVVSADQLALFQESEVAVNSLGQAFNSAYVRIASELSPYIVILSNQMRDGLGASIENVTLLVKNLIWALDAGLSGLMAFANAAATVVGSFGESISLAGKSISEALAGNFEKAAMLREIAGYSLQNSLTGSITKAVNDFNAAKASFADRAAALFSNPGTSVTGGTGLGGTSAFSGGLSAPRTAGKADAERSQQAAREIQVLRQSEQIALEVIRDASRSKIEIKRDEIRSLEAMGILSREQVIQLEGALSVDILNEDRKVLEGKILILKETLEAYRSHFGETSKEFKAFNDQASVEMLRFNAELARLNNELLLTTAKTSNALAVEVEKPWTEAMNSIGQTFQNTLAGMLNGTMTWSGAFRNILSQVGNIAAQMMANMLKQWIFKETTQTAITASGTATRGAMEQAANATSIFGIIGKVLKAIGAYAAETFGGVFAFLAPAMGPAAAGPAAASAAAVAAFPLALDVGAWEIPKDVNARIHKGETVVPANFSEGLRTALVGGTPPNQNNQGSAQTVIIQAMDAQSFMRFAKSNPAAFAEGLRRAQRNFTPATMKGAL